MHIEHLRIPVGAGALHVERVGRGGQPVVLLHGFGTCAFLWRSIAPHLAEKGFTALALDLMGYGESDRPLEAGFGIVAQAEHVDSALTAMRITQADIVGQDVGGLVALALAARRPERVGRIALINPPSPGDLPGPQIRSLQRASARVALGANSLFGAAPLLVPLLRSAVANPGNMPDVLVARYLAPFVGSDGVEHVLLLARALELTDDELAQLGRSEAPMLVVRGELDQWSDGAGLLKLFHGRPLAKSAEQATVAGAGHLVAEDNPAALAALLYDWFNAGASGHVITSTTVQVTHHAQ